MHIFQFYFIPFSFCYIELPSRTTVSPLLSANASAVNPPPLLKKATEGEKLSQMLKEQTEDLKTKVM